MAGFGLQLFPSMPDALEWLQSQARADAQAV
jgi:hypothetical protein